MQREKYRSILEKGPRPEYREDYGHQAEVEIVMKTINEVFPGFTCEKANQKEDQVEGIDLWVWPDEDPDCRLPIQCTMSTNSEILKIKKTRAGREIILITLPKEGVARSWERFRALKEHNPDIEFGPQYLARDVKAAIVGGLYQNPRLRSYLQKAASSLQ